MARFKRAVDDPSNGRDDRLRRNRHGRWSERLAALSLRVKGYRIVEAGHRNGAGEIDLIAVRGRRLAFVEVKARRTLAEAEAAITPLQRQRIQNAADVWLSRHLRYRDYEQSYDLIFVVPRHWPLHLINAL